MGESYHMPSKQVVAGMSVEAVHEAIEEASANRARKGEGPTLLDIRYI